MTLAMYTKIRLDCVDAEVIRAAREATGGLYGEGRPSLDVTRYTFDDIAGMWAAVADAWNEGKLPQGYEPYAADLLVRLDVEPGASVSNNAGTGAISAD